MNKKSFFLCALILLSSPLYGENKQIENAPREFTSWDGRKLNAQFISRNNKSQIVILKRVDNNQLVEIPYDKLSEDDIKYVKSLKNPPLDAFNKEFFKLANKFRDENTIRDIPLIIKPYRDEINKLKPSNIKSQLVKLEGMRQKDLQLYKPLSRGNLNNHAKDSASYKQISDANKAVNFLNDNGLLYYHLISLNNWGELETLKEKGED